MGVTIYCALVDFVASLIMAMIIFGSASLSIKLTISATFKRSRKGILTVTIVLIAQSEVIAQCAHDSAVIKLDALVRPESRGIFKCVLGSDNG